MPGKPPGTLVWLYYDADAEVVEGDVIETVTTQRRYRVETVRVQQKGRHVGRQHLLCTVLGVDDPNPDGATVHPLRWYSRG